MSDISDAYESAYTIMLNLNKTWVQKQGDFFVESPIILIAIPIYIHNCEYDTHSTEKIMIFPNALKSSSCAIVFLF